MYRFKQKENTTIGGSSKSWKELPRDPAIPIPGTQPPKLKMEAPAKSCARMFIATLLNRHKVETTQMGINGRVDKPNVAYAYSGI